jgi:hypothetical protein
MLSHPPLFSSKEALTGIRLNSILNEIFPNVNTYSENAKTYGHRSLRKAYFIA